MVSRYEDGGPSYLQNRVRHGQQELDNLQGSQHWKHFAPENSGLNSSAASPSSEDNHEHAWALQPQLSCTL